MGRCWSFDSPCKALQPEGEGLATMFGVLTIAVPLFAFSSVIRNSNQQLEHRYWIFRGWVFFAHPGSHMLCQVTPRPCTQLPATWLWVEMGNCYCIKSWNWPKLTAVVQGFPWNIQGFNRVQHPKIVISDRFCQYKLFSWWGNRFLVLPNLPFSFFPSSLPPFLPSSPLPSFVPPSFPSSFPSFLLFLESQFTSMPLETLQTCAPWYKLHWDQRGQLLWL